MGCPSSPTTCATRLEAGSIVLGGCCISGEDPELRAWIVAGNGASLGSRAELYELAGSGGSGAPGPLWVRLLSWIFIALLFVPVMALCIFCFKILPAIHRAKVYFQQIVRRGSA